MLKAFGKAHTSFIQRGEMKYEGKDLSVFVSSQGLNTLLKTDNKVTI